MDHPWVSSARWHASSQSRLHQGTTEKERRVLIRQCNQKSQDKKGTLIMKRLIVHVQELVVKVSGLAAEVRLNSLVASRGPRSRLPELARTLAGWLHTNNTTGTQEQLDKSHI